MENFTPLPPPPETAKKKPDKKLFFAILSLAVIFIGITVGIFITRKPIRRAVPAKEFEGLKIEWKSHTNDKGATASVEVSITNNTDQPIWNVSFEKYRFWCPNYYFLCQPGQCGENPILHCPDPDHGITGEGAQESEVIPRIEAGQTLHRTLTQDVGGNGQCGSAQVDFKVKKGNNYYENVLWGVAYQDQTCEAPTSTPTPPITGEITPPVEPSATPTIVPSATPTVVPAPKACNEGCSSFDGCQSGLECRADWCLPGQICTQELRCVNPSCPQETTTNNCVCTPPSGTPAPSNTPTLTPTPTEIVIAQNSPTSQSTSAPAVAEIPSAGMPIYLRIFSGVSLGILLLSLVL